jgi:peptidoglycan/LPS O-acetylase OafA/YrhL
MNPAIIGVFIPIVAIVCGVSVAIASILAAHRQRMQRADFRHRERLAAIEKGLELPADPAEFDPTTVLRRPRHLLRGLVLLFGGIALTIALAQDRAADYPYLFGLLPVAAGLAYLIYYFIEGKHEAAKAIGTPPPESPPGQ